MYMCCSCMRTARVFLLCVTCMRTPCVFLLCVSGCECPVSVSVITIPIKVHGIRSYDSHNTCSFIIGVPKLAEKNGTEEPSIMRGVEHISDCGQTHWTKYNH